MGTAGERLDDDFVTRQMRQLFNAFSTSSKQNYSGEGVMRDRTTSFPAASLIWLISSHGMFAPHPKGVVLQCLPNNRVERLSSRRLETSQHRRTLDEGRVQVINR